MPRFFNQPNTLMEIQIRPETSADYPAVAVLIEAAFKTMAYSDHREHLLVEKLRQSKDFIPDFSLVATKAGQLVGYILLTPIGIKNDPQIYSSLALAPVAVAPEHQGQGIGGQLILAAHDRARAAGYSSIILL